MDFPLAGTALLMGLVGGPHCLAMCGAACAGVARAGRSGRAAAMASFQGGRVLGYAGAGAVAGLAGQGFAWLAASTAVLRPAWTLFHAVVLFWGLVLLLQARQPAWVEATGRRVWTRLRPLAGARGGLLVTGALWAFMPCGLLYSALLLASLSGGPLQGAATMALFAAGTGVSLACGGLVLHRLRSAGTAGPRMAGLLLAGAAVFALWTDVAQVVGPWCGFGA